MATSTTGRQLRSITDVADELACSTRTVRRLIADGKLEGFRLSPRMLRVSQSSLDQLLRPLAAVRS